jgi:hypothetical protein
MRVGGAASAYSAMPAAIGSEFVSSVARPTVVSARPRWNAS